VLEPAGRCESQTKTVSGLLFANLSKLRLVVPHNRRESQIAGLTPKVFVPFGNVLTVTNARSVTTTYTWDYTNFSAGRLISIQEGSKPATTFTYYEPSGLIHTITRPEPNNGSGTTTTSFTYDSLGNVLTVVSPGNDSTGTITTTYNYTTDGVYSQSAKVSQPLTVTDNMGHVTHFRYDSQGRRNSVADALGNETDFSYNLIGQSDTTTYPATGQTGTGHSHTTKAYLYVGGPLTTVTSVDESNIQVRQVSYAYGPEGQSLSVLGSAEPVTNAYDALYRIKTLKDGNNNTTSYAYNTIGRLSSVTMPGGEITQFTSYDNNGNLLQRIDGNNVTTNYLYNDPESLLTDIQYPATSSLNVHFSYDSFGRRSSMTDSTGDQTLSYGNLNEPLSVTTTYTGLSTQMLSYHYYPNGSRQTMGTPAGTFSYNYDAAGRPSSMTNPFGEATGWTYHDNNWLATQTSANGATATYTHNSLGQVTRLLNQISGSTISDFSSIGYDGVGNRSSVTASVPVATTLSGTTSYQYDSRNQITQEASTRNGGFSDSFGYDSAGNPTTFKGITKTYNSNNQQTGTGLSYNGNGNPTTYNSTTLTYDPENRMTSFGAVLTAAYNGDGLRAWKQNSTGRTYFLYDGVVPEVELDANGNVIATNTFGTAGLVSRRTITTSVFYNFDSEGNVAEQSDSSGNVLSSHLFAAHGAVLSGELMQPFGYRAQVGYYTDIETGLQLLTYRYYDPTTARFLTRDPIGYSGGINIYAYTNNNPVNAVDPLGLESESNEPVDSCDPCRGRSRESMLEQFNNGLADAHMNLRVDNGGDFLNQGRSLGDILSALESNGWERFSTNINPSHWGGIHLEGQTSKNTPGHENGYWFHMIFYPRQTPVYAPGTRALMYYKSDWTKPPFAFEMHCERGGLRPSSISHGLDYAKEIFVEPIFRLFN